MQVNQFPYDRHHAGSERDCSKAQVRALWGNPIPYDHGSILGVVGIRPDQPVLLLLAFNSGGIPKGSD